MATVLVEPTGTAQDIDALATLLDAQVNITAALEQADVPEAHMGRTAVKVTGTAALDITNAITAVGGCQILDGTSIV